MQLNEKPKFKFKGEGLLMAYVPPPGAYVPFLWFCDFSFSAAYQLKIRCSKRRKILFLFSREPPFWKNNCTNLSHIDRLPEPIRYALRQSQDDSSFDIVQRVEISPAHFDSTFLAMMSAKQFGHYAVNSINFFMEWEWLDLLWSMSAFIPLALEQTSDDDFGTNNLHK